MYHRQRFVPSNESSPGRADALLPEEYEYGAARKFKPLPKRRRTVEPVHCEESMPPAPASNTLFTPTSTITSTNPTSISTTGTSIGTSVRPTAADRSWSVTANFPDIEKAMDNAITREQFMTHAGELAERLAHRLQGKRLPRDRMEFVQALLQQTAQQVGSASSGAAGREQRQQPGLSGQAGAGQAHSVRSVRGLNRLLIPGQRSGRSDHGSAGGFAETYTVPPTPGEDEGEDDINFDLEAVFSTMAGFEAGFIGVNGYDPFEDGDLGTVRRPDTWEEVAELRYSHRAPPVPPSSEVTTDVGRRGARDGEDEDEDDCDGDYHDHLWQPGNTKKRKVPANAGNSPSRGVSSSHGVYGGDDFGVRFGLQNDGDGKRPGMRFEHSDGLDPGLTNDKGPTYGPSASFLNSSGGNNLLGHRNGTIGRLPLSVLSTFASSSPSAARVGQLKSIVRSRGKLAGAMVAGIQHKEMLKARKRQLAAVMGVLSQGDTLALDQALAMVGNVGAGSLEFSPAVTMPPAGGIGKAGDGKRKQDEVGEAQNVVERNMVHVRLSRRRSTRMARAMMSVKALAGGSSRAVSPLHVLNFTFACDSATKERLLATKEEVTTLRNRFEAELERQAVNAAKSAPTSKALVAADTINGSAAIASTIIGGAKQRKTRTVGASPSKGKVASNSLSKGLGQQQENNVARQQGQQTQLPKSNQQQQQHGARQKSGQQAQDPPMNRNGSLANPQQNAASQLQQHLPLPPPSKPKKKKRSALANASNPHHLRNYVPSRLPHSGGGAPHYPPGQGQGVLQGALGPLPLRFLSAELPAGRGGSNASGTASPVANSGGKKKGGANTPATSGVGSAVALVPGEEEWICAFCEYDLFYGDDVAFKKAVRGRKKILKRRRRARERAAAAANGAKPFGKGAPATGAGAHDDFYLPDSEEESEGGHGNAPHHRPG